MAFITDFRQALIDGKSIRRGSWIKGFYIQALAIENNDTAEKVGRVLVLFSPDSNGNIAAKQYTPVWPDIMADDWVEKTA